MTAPRFSREVRDANAHTDKPWSEADRAAAHRDLRAWIFAFEAAPRCHSCSWPFASFHLCQAVVE